RSTGRVTVTAVITVAAVVISSASGQRECSYCHDCSRGPQPSCAHSTSTSMYRRCVAVSVTADQQWFSKISRLADRDAMYPRSTRVTIRSHTLHRLDVCGWLLLP